VAVLLMCVLYKLMPVLLRGSAVARMCVRWECSCTH
jgi:hypothetical protein